MKITKSQLRQIIKEAINVKLQGADMAHDYKKWAVHDHGADDWRDEAALDAYASHMSLSPCSLHDLKATLGMLGEAKIVEDKSGKGKCPKSGCIEHRDGHWRIISNKDGHLWPQKYESEESAKAGLDAFHARG